MEFQYHVPIDKLELPPPKYSPVLKRWVMPMQDPYTLAQYELLEAKLEPLLGEDWIGIEVDNLEDKHLVKIKYTGHQDEEGVDIRKEDIINPAVNEWMTEMAGG